MDPKKTQSTDQTQNSTSGEFGFSIMETLISLTLSMALFVAMTQQYASISKLNRDLRIKQTADRYARTIVNIMGFDLRITGNGIPFDQPNFQIAEDSGNLTSPLASPVKKIQPIVLDSVSDTDITLRLSESGEMYVLAANFTPSGSLNIVVTDATGLEAGNKIYVSNGSVAGSDGFYGSIQSVNTGTNTLTINAGDYVSTAGATFSTGSVLSRVSDVRYFQTGGNIYRSVDGGESVPLVANASFELTFFDYDGVEIPLAVSAPRLSEAELSEELATIEISVSVAGRNNLSTGDVYLGVVSQIFSLRNLNIIQSG